MVLKWVNLTVVHNGLERSKFYHVGNGCEMGQFALISKIPPNGLERSQHMVLKACLTLALADLSSLYGVRGEVSFNSAESPCVSPLSMLWGLMKAGSDWCLFLPLGDESSELGSTDDSLDGNDAGVNMMVIWVSSATWWLLEVMEGVFEVGQVHQTTWIWCPCSWCLERHTFHLGGLMVLKGIGFGLFLLFFHWMVLKWSAIIANGLQMCSISPVDSAIGAWIM